MIRYSEEDYSKNDTIKFNKPTQVTHQIKQSIRFPLKHISKLSKIKFVLENTIWVLNIRISDDLTIITSYIEKFKFVTGLSELNQIFLRLQRILLSYKHVSSSIFRVQEVISVVSFPSSCRQLSVDMPVHLVLYRPGLHIDSCYVLINLCIWLTR